MHGKNSLSHCVRQTLMGICIFSLSTAAAPYDDIIWQGYRPDSIRSEAAAIVLEIRYRVEELLAAGNHLRPGRQYFADIPTDGWWIYFEPGRILQTLGTVFPYLTTQQQDRVRDYVRKEIADRRFTPWAQDHYAPTEGSPQRQHYTMSRPWSWDRYWGMEGQARPLPLRMATLYGLWSYSTTTGEWNIVADNWQHIKATYDVISAGGDLYGSMSGHIAMARMASRLSDAQMMTTAVNRAQNTLQTGLSFATIDAAMKKYLPNDYYQERRSWGVYHGFMFCNLCPEVGRYLREAATPQLKNQVLLRHVEGKRKFPHWWLYRCPVFCRWTGDEGVGLPSEIIGMLFPVERWVSGADTDTLRRYMIHTAQQGIADCYVMEATVMTADAHGREKWRDVRLPRFIGPGIIVAHYADVVRFAPLFDNPSVAAVSISYVSKPAWLTESAGVLSGTAPSEDARGTIRTVLRANNIPVDTLVTTVVVTNPMEPPPLDVSRPFTERTPTARTHGHGILVHHKTSAGAPSMFVMHTPSNTTTIVTCFDLRGMQLWKQHYVPRTKNDRIRLRHHFVSGSYILEVSHNGFGSRKVVTFAR